MDQIAPALGNWIWWIVAGVLLVGELATPGIFLVWLGLAAAAVGLLDLAFDPGWQADLVLFSGFAVIFVLAARTWLARRRRPDSAEPHLNRRMDDYIGASYALDQAIESGRGRIRIDDTLWEALGPDLPRGALVKVTGVEGLKLRVEAA